MAFDTIEISLINFLNYTVIWRVNSIKVSNPLVDRYLVSRNPSLIDIKGMTIVEIFIPLEWLFSFHYFAQSCSFFLRVQCPAWENPPCQALVFRFWSTLYLSSMSTMRASWRWWLGWVTSCRGLSRRTHSSPGSQGAREEEWWRM